MADDLDVKEVEMGSLDADSSRVDTHIVSLISDGNVSDAVGTSSSPTQHTVYESKIDRQFKSVVDPTEARPDLTFYDKTATTTRRPSFQDLQVKLQNAFAAPQYEPSLRSFQRAPMPGPNPDQATSSNDDASKFGTWDGVFVSCLLNIFGVIMFLRLGWVVGQAGVGLAIVIILLSSVVTTLTTMSMSAISTNGEVGAGGAYFLISRSIGPEVGGAVGVLFSVGQSVAMALYVVGFCETLVEQIGDANSLTGDKLNDIRIYGLILAVVLFAMAYVGVGWVIKMQVGLLVLLVFAIILLICGTFYKSSDSKGITGFGGSTLSDNTGPDYQHQDGIDYDFFKVFAVFFPAVTGVMAGANISGDLKNPSENIPKGTFAAVFLSTIVYIILAIIVGAVVVRETPDGKNGLLHDNLIMVELSVWGPIVLCGIYAATFSSALASLVGAPRILMSVAHDRLLPVLDPFAVVRERDGSPLRGYWLTFFIACACILIGDLNLIAPLISMFFMITYALINFSAFMLEISKSPGWRPSYKYFNWMSSLTGTILCIVAMFLTNWFYALMAVLVGFIIYKYVETRKPNVNWGSASEARRDKEAMEVLLNLRQNKENVKNFRPSYLVMTGDPINRTHLVHFASTLKKGFGATILGQVVLTKDYRQDVLAFRDNNRGGYFFDPVTGMEAFVESVMASNFRIGCQSLVQLAGLGSVRPNTLVLGYKEDWKTDQESTDDYVKAIGDAFRMHFGVVIGRGLDRIDLKSAEVLEGTLDVWWLVDDGGLTLLIPYILARHRFWKSHTATKGATKVRLFLVVEKLSDLAPNMLKVAKMLKAFRLNQWEPNTLSTDRKPPSKDTLEVYAKVAVRTPEQQARPEVTHRWLRVAELVRENSANASLVVCSLPFPRDDDDSLDYMSWLEMLSKDMPPMLLMRGNGRNCLTFYSE